MTARPTLRLEAVLLALALLAGLLLRVVDVERLRMSPDEGNYLFSARVHRLATFAEGASVADAVAEDVEWAWPRYWPHSYAHQLVTRWLHRFGTSSVGAVRLDSAILAR